MGIPKLVSLFRWCIIYEWNSNPFGSTDFPPLSHSIFPLHFHTPLSLPNFFRYYHFSHSRLFSTFSLNFLNLFPFLVYALNVPVYFLSRLSHSTSSFEFLTPVSFSTFSLYLLSFLSTSSLNFLTLLSLSYLFSTFSLYFLTLHFCQLSLTSTFLSTYFLHHFFNYFIYLISHSTFSFYFSSHYIFLISHTTFSLNFLILLLFHFLSLVSHFTISLYFLC